LLELGFRVQIYNNNMYNDIDLESFDGIFLSNGPGNPEEKEKFISWLHVHVNNPIFITPIYGILPGMSAPSFSCRSFNVQNEVW